MAFLRLRLLILSFVLLLKTDFFRSKLQKLFSVVLGWGSSFGLFFKDE